MNLDAEKGIKNLPWIFVGIGIAISAIAAASWLYFIVSKNDPPNITTLIVEIGFGIAITLTVFLYSKRQHNENKAQQEKISKFLKEQNKVLQSEKERVNRWKYEWGSLILTELESVNMFYGILEKWLVDYWENPSDEQKSNLPFAAKRNGSIIKYHFQNIHRYIPHIEEHFDDPKLGITLTNISTSQQFTIIFEVLDQDYYWESNSQPAIDTINDKKRVITNMINKIKKEIPENT